MIDTPIIDTHLHLWDVDRMNYAWLDDTPQLSRSFLLPDYVAATENVPIEKMVFLQCECDPIPTAKQGRFPNPFNTNVGIVSALPYASI